MMAGQMQRWERFSPQTRATDRDVPGQSGLAAQCLAGIALALCASWAGAQSAPLTGQMGGADARTVAQATAAPAAASAVPQAAATDATVAQATQAAPATQPAQAPQASRVPPNSVRRTTPLRVGEHAADGMLGDETEALLALQASNQAAGRGLPMLGATASRAYKRYLDSFTYAIPAFYPTMVQSDGAGGGGGGGSGAASGGGTGASQ
ncbi:DUF3613 domain-containing protein [Pandoraea sp. PE-S2R-1]|uniref:DUF3613 domain-containing protein n=1 Tax=Pandoraea sp. PE-S2R-1 TaxID=1986994 RepID=UPI001482EB3C|nr:DUF3613 domain-containing protein [Pandoraea sp. PE-S2R-1]